MTRWSLAAVVAALCTATSALASPTDSIVVTGFAGDDLGSDTRELLNELLVTDVQHRLADRKVIAPSDIDALIGLERAKDLMGCDDAACAAEIGGALGAAYLVTGRLGILGESLVMTLKLINLKATSVESRVTQTVATRDQGQIAAAITQMVADLAFDGKKGTPPPQPEPVPPKETLLTAPPPAPPPDPVSQRPVVGRAKRPISGGFYIAAAAALVLTASIAWDVAAPSSKDGKLTGIDFLPIVGYGVSAAGLLMGVRSMR